MKLLYILIASFVLIATSSLTLGQAKRYYDSQTLKVLSYEAVKENQYISVPKLKENAILPELSAQSIYAIDLESNLSLYERNIDTPILPASTTKIITALVAMDKYPLDLILTVGDVSVDGQNIHLIKGEKITVRNLLYGLLIASGNDAAEVLADGYSGGRDEFVKAMNLKAQDLGLINSNFVNPSGLDGDGHHSTARDLIKASVFAMQRPFFKKAVSIKEVKIESVDNQTLHHLRNINELLGKVDGVLGIKTGWTQEARENLITYVERDGKKIMIAILASQDRFGETENLINWIFENYEWKKVLLLD